MYSPPLDKKLGGVNCSTKHLANHPQTTHKPPTNHPQTAHIDYQKKFKK